MFQHGRGRGQAPQRRPAASASPGHWLQALPPLPPAVALQLLRPAPARCPTAQHQLAPPFPCTQRRCDSLCWEPGSIKADGHSADGHLSILPVSPAHNRPSPAQPSPAAFGPPPAHLSSAAARRRCSSSACSVCSSVCRACTGRSRLHRCCMLRSTADVFSTCTRQAGGQQRAPAAWVPAVRTQRRHAGTAACEAKRTQLAAGG